MKKMLFRPEGGDPGAAGTTTAGAPGANGSADPGSGNGEGWKAPENQAAVDKLINDAVAGALEKETAKYKAPDRYDLKLSGKAKVDPGLTERTGAIARDLGLSQEKAQKALDFVSGEAAREVEAALSQYAPPSDQNPEGGAKWKEQNDAWKAAALTDKELGNGDPEKLKVATDLAKKVLAKFGDPESIDFVDSALGSNPAVLRVLVRIGRAMSEQGLVKGPNSKGTPKDPKLIMYNEDGSPKESAQKTE